MVTISKPLSASQAQTYHKEEFSNKRDNYYTQGDTIRGEWHGKLATQWGLFGDVQEEQFEHLSEGRHPQTGEQLVEHRTPRVYENESGETVKTLEHRAGWDATFSAPKSVSLTALVGGDDRVRDAHRESVRVALGEMERFVQARIGGNHPAETTGKWVAAKFEHDSSRPVDGYAAPQLHTHVVIFNVTEAANGRTRAVQPQELYRSQQYATAVYQSELAHRMKGLGYEIETGKNNAPEIKGYTQPYLAANSPRRQQITEHLEQHGFSGAGPAQIAAHQTRDGKLPLSQAEMRQLHQDVARAYDNQPARVVATARERGAQHYRNEEVDKHAQLAVTYARDKNLEREAVTDERELIRDALRRGAGQTTFEAIRENFENRQNTGEFVEVAHQRRNSPSRAWTTQDMLDREQAILQTMRDGNGRYASIVKEKTIRMIQERGLDGHLNASQRRAVHQILESRDQITGLQGSAGTGKTASLAVVRTAAENDGYQVHGLAPTTRAAKQLEDAGIQSTTLQHLLTRGENAGGPGRTLYILDESSLASTKQMNEFLDRVREQDRILVVGDTRQHQGVEAGRPFQQMHQAGMQTAHLDEIVRQRDPALKQAVEQLSRGEVKEAIENLRDQRRVHQVSDAGQRMMAIAKEYTGKPDNTLVVSPDNKSRKAINRTIHKELQLLGKVDQLDHRTTVLSPRQDLTGADRQWAAKYDPGDIVRYTKGSRQLGLKAGEYVLVEHSDRHENSLTVVRGDGQRLAYDPRRLQGVTVYREAEREFARGDRVQFTAPFKRLNVANREMGTIESIDEHQNLGIRMESGRAIQFNLGEHAHLDHGYAVTSYSGQGQTADRVLVHVDTTQHEKLVNSRFAYVSLSRGRYDAQIYTDSAAHLGQELSREVSKQSALDSQQAHRQQHELSREPSAQQSRTQQSEEQQPSHSQGRGMNW